VKYNLLLVGGPNENSFSQQYLDRTGLVHTQGKFVQPIGLRMFLHCLSVFSRLGVWSGSHFAKKTIHQSIKVVISVKFFSLACHAIAAVAAS